MKMSDEPRRSQPRPTPLLLRRLAGEAGHRPAVWLMRQAGRYLPEYRAIRGRAGGFLDMCYNVDFATEVTLQPIRRFGLDAAILFSDILVLPHALGAAVRFVEGEGPQLDPITTAPEIDGLDPSRVPGHVAPVLDTLRRLRRELPDEVALLGFAGAPWTVAAYMVEGGGSREYQRARTLARTDPGLFQALIDRITDATIDYLDQQAAAGAQAVQVFDSWAGVLPPAELARWSIEPSRRIVEGLRARRPDLPVLLFPRGVGASLLDYRALGAAALSLDTTVPMRWAVAELSDVPCLQGNLDPLALLGPVDAMLAEASAIAEAARGRAHIFNLGHGVVPQTPPESVARLIEHLKSIG